MDSLYDGVYFVDLNRGITYWNRGAERLTGYTREEAIGRACQDNFLAHVDDTGKSLCESGCPLGLVLQDGEPREVDLYLHHKNGHRVPVTVRAAPLRTEDGHILGAVEIFSDNSSHVMARRRIDELEQLALLDPLTRIGNRRFLDMTLEARLVETVRYNTQLAVFFLDIDDFKQINDTKGHDTGDEVLKVVAKTLSGVIRPTDILGRWGGEEFVAAASNINRETALAIGERFRALIEGSSVSIPDGRIHFTISVGVTIARRDDDLGSVIKRADDVMYEAKREGKNRIKFG
jgi:diguanylate cyclase (GGDEF)-like protein/PAS domain S-box-containing protein